MTIFRRNVHFHIGKSGAGKTVIHRESQFERALDENPAAATLFAALVEDEAKGRGQVYQFELPEPPEPKASRMTLKEFKATFGDKPGVTFHCPEHLKHELEA